MKVLNRLKYQSRLTVTELDSFLSEFHRVVSLPIEEPTVEDRDLLIDDVYLGNKVKFFREQLEAYEKCIKRIRKMDQTIPMTELNKQRKKQLLGTISYICGSETDYDEAIAEAAETLSPKVEEFKHISRLTNASLSSHITRFILMLREEKYASAYETLKLSERIEELERLNHDYITLATERAAELESVPDSPSETRKQCVHAYYDLVELVNFALQNNKYYLYDEKAVQLEGITQEAQELINRRRNKSTASDDAVTEENAA